MIIYTWFYVCTSQHQFLTNITHTWGGGGKLNRYEKGIERRIRGILMTYSSICEAH